MHSQILEEGADDDIEDLGLGADIEKLTKSRVVHIRVDVEMWRAIRAAAFRVDRKPCAWIRRAIKKELKVQERRRKSR